MTCPPWRSMIERHRRMPVPSVSAAAAGGRRNIASYGTASCSCCSRGCSFFFAISLSLPSVGSGRSSRPLVSNHVRSVRQTNATRPLHPSPLPSPGGRGGRVLFLRGLVARVKLRHRERDSFVDPHGNRAARTGDGRVDLLALLGGKPPEHPVPLRHSRRRGVYADSQSRVLARAQRPLDVLQPVVAAARPAGPQAEF